MNNCGDSAPDVLPRGALKRAEDEFSALLPPNDDIVFARRNCTVYDG
jgi:hypothetical protein